MAPLMRVCKSWRIKLLLSSFLLLLLLCVLKNVLLDSISDVERCDGPHCNKLGLIHSNIKQPVVLVAAAESHPPFQPPKPASRRTRNVIIPHHPMPHPSNHQTQSPLPRFHNLTSEEIGSVEHFVFFIGYGRSGHSIIASIMDAHPNVIIAHEYYLFDKLTDVRQYETLYKKKTLFDGLYWSSYTSALSGWRANKKTAKGYNLNLNGTWQGWFERLKVIGDKTAGATAMLYHKSPLLFKSTLRNLRKITGVPLLAVHVVRNPYDMIATVALFQASTNPKNLKVNASITHKFHLRHYLDLATNIVLTKAAAVQAMVLDCHLNVLEVHLEDLIANPKAVIVRMCEFLGVACDQAYVKACEEKVFRKESRSRDVVVWPKDVKARVKKAIGQFSFFRRYSF